MVVLDSFIVIMTHSCHHFISSETTASTLVHSEKALSLQTPVMVADGHCKGAVSQTKPPTETGARILHHLSCRLTQSANSLQFSEADLLLNVFDI